MLSDHGKTASMVTVGCAPTLAILALGMAGFVLAGFGERSDPAKPSYGTDRPVAAIDRFGGLPASGRGRTETNRIPAVNQPLDLDHSGFLRRITGPGGEERNCYDLGFVTAEPSRLFVFYDQQGNYVLTQFPIIEVLPGEPDYSDIWDVWRVFVPPGFSEYNQLRDMEDLERKLADSTSGFRTERTGIWINGPVVPDGSRAALRADNKPGPAPLRYAWRKGERVPFLYFEGSIRGAGRTPPRGKMVVSCGTWPPQEGTRVEVSRLPGQPGYSPLFELFDPQGNKLAPFPLNCPIVGEP